MAEDRAARWAGANAKFKRAELAYFSAGSARARLVAEWKAAGASWGELSALTGLDRAQLVRMARRAGWRNENDSRTPE